MHNNSTKERTIVASQASDTLHGSQMAPQPWRNGKVRMAPQLTTRGRPPYRKRPVKSVICSTCRTTNKKTHHKIKIGSRALMISRMKINHFYRESGNDSAGQARALTNLRRVQNEIAPTSA